MHLLYFQTRIYDDKNKKAEMDCIGEMHFTYAETLKEVHEAIMKDYGISHIGDHEFQHLIVLVRYIPHSNVIETLIVRGTREEINDLQRDPFVSRSMLR